MPVKSSVIFGLSPYEYKTPSLLYPKEKHPKTNPDLEGSQQVGEDQVKMFDIDLQEWRSCRYSKISQVRVKLHTYNTFPGTFATREEYFESCRGSPL